LETKVLVAQSAMTFTLGTAGGSAEDLEAVLESTDGKAALSTSIAQGLNVAADKVNILSVKVGEASRMLGAAQQQHEGRQLADQHQVNVEFTVQASADSDAGQLSNQILGLGNSGSDTSSQFAAALGTNLATAATALGSDLLASVAADVQSNGVVVSAVAMPEIAEQVITLTSTTTALAGISSDDDSISTGRIILNILAALLGIACGIGLGLLFCKSPCYRRLSQVSPTGDSCDSPRHSDGSPQRPVDDLSSTPVHAFSAADQSSERQEGQQPVAGPLPSPSFLDLGSRVFDIADTGSGSANLAQPPGPPEPPVTGSASSRLGSKQSTLNLEVESSASGERSDTEGGTSAAVNAGSSGGPNSWAAAAARGDRSLASTLQ